LSQVLLSSASPDMLWVSSYVTAGSNTNITRQRPTAVNTPQVPGIRVWRRLSPATR